MTYNDTHQLVSLQSVVDEALNSNDHRATWDATAALVWPRIFGAESTADCYFDAAAINSRLQELEPTEDAEVISITTVHRNH